MSDPAENRDVRGNTIKPHSVEAENVNAKNATVESEPSEANEIARKVDIDAKADLDSTTGVLKSSQVPDLAITSVSTVPDQSSRLSLSVEEGDVAIQTDTDTTFIFTGGDPSVNSNWSEIVLDVLDAISGSTISPDTVNANSVNTDDLDINNEVLIAAEKTSDQSYSSANGTVKVTFDNEVTDVTGDLDLANDVFTVPETGHYDVSAAVTVNSYSDGDELWGQLRSNSTGRKVRIFRHPGGTGSETIEFSGEFRLSSNETYQIAFRNVDSDDNILGRPDSTFFTVSRSEEA